MPGLTTDTGARSPRILDLPGADVILFKHKKRKELKASVELTHGSLLIMCGGTQANWLHQIPKTAKPVEERLNLTFRAIVAPESSDTGYCNTPGQALRAL